MQDNRWGRDAFVPKSANSYKTTWWKVALEKAGGAIMLILAVLVVFIIGIGYMMSDPFFAFSLLLPPYH